MPRPGSLSVLVAVLLTASNLLADPDLRINVTQDAPTAPARFDISVYDNTGAPVGDAAVIVRLPESAPTGTFPDGSHSAVAYSDETGKASLAGVRWDHTTGIIAVKITATRGSSRAETETQISLGAPATKPQAAAAPVTPAASAPIATPAVTSTAQAMLRPPSPAPSISVINTPTHEHISSGGHKKWYILAAVAAAGVGAGVAFMGKKSSSSASSTSTSTTIGSPTINIGGQ